MKNIHKLLTREQFKEFVFKRDKYTCIFCSLPATSAHHIIERKLWPDGGYYLNNGASVCDEHHWACEKTDISVRDVWEKCGVSTPFLPPHFSACFNYDKWGNIIHDDLTREVGEMFWDENVQKVLEDKIHLFGF